MVMVLTQLPPSVILEIGQTDVGLKGDTQSGANKPATTTTGLTIQVPLSLILEIKLM